MFSLNCRVAADEKAKAKICYKRNPTQPNKRLYASACLRMKRTQERAIRRRLGKIIYEPNWSGINSGGIVTSKTRVSLLMDNNGFTACSSDEKTELRASFFASKMKVSDLGSPPTTLPPVTRSQLDPILITEQEVQRHLKALDVTRAALTHLSIVLTRWQDYSLNCFKHAYCKTNGQKHGNLLSCLTNVYERKLIEYTTNFLDIHHLISNGQFGPLKSWCI